MSNEYCCVPDCKSHAKKSPDISFHRFPRQETGKVFIKTKLGQTRIDRRRAWEMLLKMGKRVSSRMVVCSLHFTENDYFVQSTKRKWLKLTAVPSLNLPVGSHDSVVSTLPSSRSKRAANRKLLREQLNKNNLCRKHLSEDGQHEVQATYNEEGEAAADALLLLINNPSEHKPITFKDFAVQVNTPTVLTVCNLIKTEGALKSLTGLQNFEMVNFLLTSVNLVYKDQRVHRISVKDRIVLTFIKLKCDLSFATLAVLFQFSSVLCKTYFIDMIILYQVLQPTVYFRSKDEIDTNMPLCFKEFKDTQVVLDCTECFVQKPKCLCCRIRFYSNYKSTGLISFVSKALGGRASDKCIFTQSQIITKLEKDAAVMVDKGFLIDDICASYAICLYRPPFLKAKKQLEKVHVERANQRIKIFKILCNRLQWSLVEYINEIFFIACAITSPIYLLRY
ncbi:hypothetical protein RN001_012421 [Aquatica leii]|uniref:THAP-type domain-containing protein n=1 Tax=Aquatica leii TaxID=1421715 RepID=A0AAN7SF56_9COLE|nr:hypothetical protein RN001_012421 [Aquatica leii]